MLILLPILTFCISLLFLWGHREGGSPHEAGRPRAFLLSAILWGTFVAVVSELLSPVNAITQLALALLWGSALVALTAIGIRKGTLSAGWRRLKNSFGPKPVFDWIALGAIALVLAVLLVIAWVSPPNNHDSYFYHMTRVMRWAQNQNLRHFPTQHDHNLLKPIWAETAILHLRVLFGSDRPANLVQWFSFLGSVVGVAGIASLLGLKRRGQLAAAAFAVSVPSAVLQSTTAYNDIVSAFWVISLAYLIVLGKKRDLTRLERWGMALSFGLGVLSKGHFFVYAPPLLAWRYVPMLFRKRPGRALVEAVFVIGVAIALNLGFWARNVETYGGPYGTSEWLRRNLWFLNFIPSRGSGDHLDPGFARDDSQSAPALKAAFLMGGARSRVLIPPLQSVSTLGSIDPGRRELIQRLEGVADPILNYLRRLAQTAGRNMVAPTARLHSIMIGILELFPGIFGDRYVSQQRYAAWNHEDLAGNPLHALLVPPTLIAIVLMRRKQDSLVIQFALILLAAYALGPVVIGHAPSQWGIRYQIPFFMIWGATAGAAVSIDRDGKAALVATGALLAASLPWLLLNNHRPLIGMPPWPTRTHSILIEDPVNLTFAMNLGLKDDYVMPTDRIIGSGCREVGLAVHTGYLEYPIWWLLEAPQSGIRVESLYPTDHSRRYSDANFTPCAVICTVCDDAEEFDGLPIVGQYDSTALYLERSILGE